MKHTVTLPLRLPSVANKRMHHMAKAHLVSKQREAVHLALKVSATPNFVPRLCVTITRVAPRELDDDNNVACAKAVRDEVAAWFGLDDRDPRIKWDYAQEKGPVAVRIDIDIVYTIHVAEPLLLENLRPNETYVEKPAKAHRSRVVSERPVTTMRDLALKATPNIVRNK